MRNGVSVCSMCKAQAVNGQKLAATVAATALLAGVCYSFYCSVSSTLAGLCVALGGGISPRVGAGKNQAS